MTIQDEQAYIHRIKQLEAENDRLKSENKELVNVIRKLWRQSKKRTM